MTIFGFEGQLDPINTHNFQLVVALASIKITFPLEAK